MKDKKKRERRGEAGAGERAESIDRARPRPATWPADLLTHMGSDALQAQSASEGAWRANGPDRRTSVGILDAVSVGASTVTAHHRAQFFGDPRRRHRDARDRARRWRKPSFLRTRTLSRPSDALTTLLECRRARLVRIVCPASARFVASGFHAWPFGLSDPSVLVRSCPRRSRRWPASLFGGAPHTARASFCCSSTSASVGMGAQGVSMLVGSIVFLVLCVYRIAGRAEPADAVLETAILAGYVTGAFKWKSRWSFLLFRAFAWPRVN